MKVWFMTADEYRGVLLKFTGNNNLCRLFLKDRLPVLDISIFDKSLARLRCYDRVKHWGRQKCCGLDVL